MAVRPVPEGYHTATPYLYVKGGVKALDFYKKAFGATELMRMEGPGGSIGHAEIKIGDSPIMLSDESPEMGARSPESYGGSAVGLMLYVPNVDETVKRAVGAGAKLDRAVEDKFYGDRMGSIIDPFGHIWYIATHVEDGSPDEMKRRAKAMMAQK